MHSENEVAAHIVDLQDVDKNKRLHAVMALGQMANVAALPALLARLSAEPDFFVRDNVSWALLRIGDAAVLPLIAMLDDTDHVVRYHAVHSLSKLADARAVEALIATLDDTDLHVAQKAIYALGRIRDARALPALTSRLGNGSREAKNALHDALVAFGATAVPHLVVMREHADIAVRVEVTEVLGAIGGSAVLSALAAAMTDAAWEVRFAALNAMRDMHDPIVDHALVIAGQDEHVHVRLLANRLLQERH